MNFPIRMTFKILALAPQISVTDATGRMVLYVRQKAFKLSESVTIFADAEQTRRIATIEADRVIDWSASYAIHDADGRLLGTVKRRGGRSLWRAHYEIESPDGSSMLVREANPWVKVVDGIFGEIPVIGLLAGYAFHPAYRLLDATGSELFRTTKQPALFEGVYEMQQFVSAAEDRERLAVLAMLMVVLLERARG